MSSLRPAFDPIRPTRRQALIGAAALSLFGPGEAGAAGAPFRVGTLPFGTAQWELATISGNGFDKAAGLDVQNVPLAGNEAARIAFLSGSVDAIVNDLLFAARLKAEGKPILFMPYSSTEGGLMVPASSPVKSVGDLKGKSIGVAGGPLDKSWLLLRAAAQKDGIDLASAAKPVFGAPPLLAAKVESGELDCGLLYWSACARLAAKGYREVFTVEDLASRLGAKGKIAFVGFLFHADADPKRLAAFSKAVRDAEALLATKPDAWAPIRPLMQAGDERTFAALKDAFIRGIPKKARPEEIADAQAFFAVIAKIGGAALLGEAHALPADLYVDQAIFG